MIVKFANQGGKIVRSTIATPGACRFWVKGECARGAHCPFRHEAATETEEPSSCSAEKSVEADRSPRQCRSAEAGSPRARRAEALRSYHGPLDVNSALFRTLASEAFSSDEGHGELADSDGGEEAYEVADELGEQEDIAVKLEGHGGIRREAAAQMTPQARGENGAICNRLAQLGDKKDMQTEPKSDDELAALKPQLASWRQRSKTVEVAALFSQKRRELEAELLSNLDQPFCRYVATGTELAAHDGAELVREQQLDDMLKGLFKNSAGAGAAVVDFSKPRDDFSFGSY